jgi:hypothetical protein
MPNDTAEARRSAALNLAIKKLAKVKDRRVLSVDADLSSAEEDRPGVPLLIRAPVADGLEPYKVEKKLAVEVFGPVYHETQVCLPMIMLRATENVRESMASEDGLMVPLFGRH